MTVSELRARLEELERVGAGAAPVVRRAERTGG
jgi:hypothetical protein